MTQNTNTSKQTNFFKLPHENTCKPADRDTEEKRAI